ncbi:hypothetical protein N783_19745, partial [Pontibacillus marinus BH030004 = DSM 16465]
MSNEENKPCQQPASLSNCRNRPITPDVNPDAQIAKIPVVLAEVEVCTDLEAKVTFPEDVLEIKDVKKQIELVQCRLLVPSNQLYIKGYVRKNIQYVTPVGRGLSNKCVDSDYRSFTVDVPFTCVTEIKDFITRPLDIHFDERKEFNFRVSQSLPKGYPEKDHYQSQDISQFNQGSQQFYNEIPYCDLLSSNIIEMDASTDRRPIQGGPEFEGVFRNVVEKMSVCFTLKLLQKQQVPLGGITGPTGPTGPGAGVTGPTGPTGP